MTKKSIDSKDLKCVGGNAMSMAGSPSFGKTLLTNILHIILHKNRVEESLILLRLSCFYLCLSPAFLKENIQVDLPAMARIVGDEAERREIFPQLIQMSESGSALEAVIEGSPLVEMVIFPGLPCG